MKRDNSRQFNQEIDKIVRAMNTAMKEIAVLSSDAFDRNFATESFFGNKWKPSKYTQNKEGKSRHLLHKTGALRMSLKYTISKNVITFKSVLPYANVHNEGFKGTQSVNAYSRYNKKTGRITEVSAHSRRMNIPKRQFVGDAPALERLIENIILKQIK